MEAIVKVDDTTVGVEAGLNAGMWAVGIARSGNLVGLSEQELTQLAPADQARRVEQATADLHRCGAHFVVDTIADLPSALEDIQRRLAAGERP